MNILPKNHLNIKSKQRLITCPICWHDHQISWVLEYDGNMRLGYLHPRGKTYRAGYAVMYLPSELEKQIDTKGLPLIESETRLKKRIRKEIKKGKQMELQALNNKISQAMKLEKETDKQMNLDSINNAA